MRLTSPNLIPSAWMLIMVAFLCACAADPTVTPTHRPRPRATTTPTALPTSALTPTWTAIPGSDRSLRSAAAVRGIYIGAAVDTFYLFGEQKYMTTLGREFNMLTPETEMKFDLVEPQQGHFDFTAADQLIDFARANNMAVRGHVLVWHQAIPAWFEDGEFTRDESIAVLRALVTTQVSHFRGQVVAWDVVNEALYDDGGYRDSIWYRRIGPEYITMAFQWAHEADPNALLFYNDYGIDDLNPKSTAVYNLLEQLKASGVPVSGVGLQMHIRADYPPRPASVKANMERFAALGLAVHITEMDVSTTYLRGTRDAQLRQQRDVYAQIGGVCLEVKACTALVVWGISDRHTWLHTFTGPSEQPLLFDEYYRPKLAYDALLDAMQTVP